MTGEGRRESANERLGANVRVLRERMDMSQAELARLMTERGWPWHQSTVYRVESGRQTVSFDEAVDLAAILQTSLDRFTWLQPEASATEYVYAAGTRVVRSSEDVAVAVHMLLSARAAAERTVEMTKDSKYPRVHEAREDTTHRLENYGLDVSVAEGISRYEERFGEDGEDDDDGQDEEGQPGVMDQQ